MNIIKIFFIFLVVISCNTNDTDFIGNYKSKEMNFLDRVEGVLTNKKGWFTGTSLEIKSDSTYNMQTCSLNMNGNWTKKGDSLFLKPTYKSYRIDSLNHSKKWKKYLTVEKHLEIYLIKKNSLEMVMENKSNIARLIKIE